MRKLIIFLVGVLTLSCSSDEQYRQQIEEFKNPELFNTSMKKLSDIIVHDIFSPPVASRIYAYPSIAAYEALIHDYPDYVSLSGQLTDFAAPPKPEQGVEYSFPLASFHAFHVVGKALIFSEEKMETYQESFYEDFREMGMPQEIFDRSVAYGDQVAAHILGWADKDNYKQTRTFPKYTVMRDDYAWKPTPPDYMEGIEPHWNKIRPFLIDSATQFVPDPPTPFDMDKESIFYKELIEVYEVGVNLDDEQKEIASFWDCNPYVSHHRGHAMFATKKITPGGHWIGITAIASRQANLDLMKTVETYARVSIALSDAFIVCWDEKWRSILIRPETVINEYLDEDWVPFLQTPPFPEYTSGHSVISTAAAMTLTDLLGENFQFADTTEMEYGLPMREFDSFLGASQEAAVSRLYGGIHYMPAITNGVAQGKEVGAFIIENLDTQKPAMAKKD
jgi:hypothetical protein